MSGPALRILHIRTVRGTGGGPDKTVLTGCHYLRRWGHRAEAFYIMDAVDHSGRLEDMARALDVPMHVALESSPVSLGTVWGLHRALRAGRYNIVHTHEYKSNVLAQLLRGHHSYRIIATAHGYNRTTRREALYYALERAMFRHVDAVIAPTRQMSELLRGLGVPVARLHVIPNGIELSGRDRPARAPSRGTVRLLYLGRLSREKDPANLLRALHLLRLKGLAVEAILAGEGPERPVLERLCADLGLEEVARLPGFVADVVSLFAQADILVSPSQTECMPNSILEAMWAGTPVVATRVGGVDEMIRHGQEGLLCRASDPEDLAGAIHRLATDKALQHRLAASAYERVIEDFSFERRMQRVLALYERIVASRPGGGV
jgi:glycosyltransferase involved in cell wall biosynthesis